MCWSPWLSGYQHACTGDPLWRQRRHCGGRRSLCLCLCLCLCPGESDGDGSSSTTNSPAMLASSNAWKDVETLCRQAGAPCVLLRSQRQDAMISCTTSQPARWRWGADGTRAHGTIPRVPPGAADLVLAGCCGTICTERLPALLRASGLREPISDLTSLNRAIRATSTSPAAGQGREGRCRRPHHGQRHPLLHPSLFELEGRRQSLAGTLAFLMLS